MADMNNESDSEAGVRESATPYERFEALTKRLLHVSKSDLREAEARDQDKRRSA